jgi:hypothetical protein
MSKKLFVIAFFAAVLLGTACQKSADEQILGTWKIESINTSESMDDVSREMFKQTNAEIIEKSTYTFEKEGVMKFSMDGTNSTWKWDLSDDAKSITFDIDGTKRTYDVKSLTEKEMILDDKIAEGNVQTSTYKKQ